MKRGLLVLSTFLFVVMFSSGIYAVGESCTITTRDLCQTDHIVMGLSGLTNAHGELANQTNYNYVLCCNFVGSTTCTGTNKILGLSSATNAHAEVPNMTAYLNNVCYENLKVTVSTTDCGGNLSLVSLSNYTNAHIGGINDYPIKLCATSPNFGPGEFALWSSDGSTQTSSLDIVPGTTKIMLVLKNSALTQGSSIDFNILERDLFFDDSIRTISGTVGVNGTATVEWTITSDDLEKTENNDYSGFYFSADNHESNTLSLTVLNVSTCNNVAICSEYSSQSLCETDACGIALNSAPSSLECNDPNNNCFCGWDADANKCGFNFDVINPETNVTLGTCVFAESTGDDCSDGFLSYSWTTSWTGDVGDRPLTCADGSKVIECPAQIQLPFFGVYNFFLTALVIALIYLAMLTRKKG